MNRLRIVTSKITAASFQNRHHQLSQKFLTSVRQLQISAAMSSCEPGFPYHVHKVTVRQESMLTKGQIIDFDISVIDTHPGDKEKATVVGVHGIPGSGTDFEPCIQRLAESSVRFIGPTFPGFETSEIEPWKLYHLNYSSTACASLVLQVLDHLGIDRVSMVMTHSAGGWTGYNLAAQSHRVKSLCLLNPGGGRPHRTLRPPFVIHFMAWVMRIKSLHFLLMPLMELVYRLIGFRGVKGGDHLMVAQQLLSSQDFDHTIQHAAQIQEKQLPLLFAYTLNDKIIERDVYEEMLFKHLNVPRAQVTRVDAGRNQIPLCGSSVDQEPEQAWFAQGLQFERGGHIVHKAYCNIIMDHVARLLGRVEKGNTMCR
ncbi:uncharacterized protein F35H12.5-like [Babylonia areolata]|uniref:uncharacterized protein F35H12.5-like n=1 Tax=Babylonia areolata TaxID=304850 RepID=UPI003FCFFFC3